MFRQLVMRKFSELSSFGVWRTLDGREIDLGVLSPNCFTLLLEILDVIEAGDVCLAELVCNTWLRQPQAGRLGEIAEDIRHRLRKARPVMPKIRVRGAEGCSPFHSRATHFALLAGAHAAKLAEHGLETAARDELKARLGDEFLGGCQQSSLANLKVILDGRKWHAIEVSSAAAVDWIFLAQELEWFGISGIPMALVRDKGQVPGAKWEELTIPAPKDDEAADRNWASISFFLVNTANVQIKPKDEGLSGFPLKASRMRFAAELLLKNKRLGFFGRAIVARWRQAFGITKQDSRKETKIWVCEIPEKLP